MEGMIAYHRKGQNSPRDFQVPLCKFLTSGDSRTVNMAGNNVQMAIEETILDFHCLDIINEGKLETQFQIQTLGT